MLEKEIEEFSNELYICTDDGSKGTKGFVSNVLQSLIDEGKKLCIAREDSKEWMDCDQKFGFVKNMVLIRENNLQKALLYNKKLTKKYGQETPRFHIQQAYILWKIHMKMIKGYRKRNLENDERAILEESIKCGIDAYNLCKKDLKRFARCSLLAPADISISYSYNWDIENAKKVA